MKAADLDRLCLLCVYFRNCYFFSLKEKDCVFYLKHSNGNTGVKTLFVPSHNIQVRKVPQGDFKLSVCVFFQNIIFSLIFIRSERENSYYRCYILIEIKIHEIS